MEDQRGWVLARKETEAGMSLLRLKTIEPEFDFGSFPERFNVIWDFQDPTNAGTPSARDSEAMKRFEDRVCERIESEDQAILCMVFTKPGYREYVFLSRDIDSFLNVLNTIPREPDLYPIEIHHEVDNAHEFYNSYAQGIRRAP